MPAVTTLNTALWGVESWTLTAQSVERRKLQRFHRAAICKIMNITMFKVEEKRITKNRKLRESFDNIRNITNFIEESKQLTWLERVLTMDPTLLAF